jgi:hypothetical protein
MLLSFAYLAFLALLRLLVGGPGSSSPAVSMVDPGSIGGRRSRSSRTVRKAGDDLEIEATTTTVDQREIGMTSSPLGMIRTPSTLHVRARLTPHRGQP